MRIVALCGTSGSGKSTAAAILCPHIVTNTPIARFNIVEYISTSLNVTEHKMRKILSKYVDSNFIEPEFNPVTYMSFPKVDFTLNRYEVAFADTLKCVVSVLFGIDYNIVSGNVSEELRTYRDTHVIDTGFDKCSGLTTRELLKYTATFLRKAISDELFVNIVLNKIQEFQNFPKSENVNLVVISDLRYDVEYAVLQKNSIPIYRIIRNDYINPDEDYAHFKVTADIHNDDRFRERLHVI
jgi:hypothetical protein